MVHLGITNKLSNGWLFMNILLLLSLVILCSCKEMHDEDFREFQERQRNEANSGKGQYQADLQSTDQTLRDLEGDLKININGNSVDIAIAAKGVPDNLQRIQYGYMNADCRDLSIAIPHDPNSTQVRSPKLSDSITVQTLRNDLIAAGIQPGANINLHGVSFIVKAFAQSDSAPVTILCGRIVNN